MMIWLLKSVLEMYTVPHHAVDIASFVSNSSNWFKATHFWPSRSSTLSSKPGLSVVCASKLGYELQWFVCSIGYSSLVLCTITPSDPVAWNLEGICMVEESLVCDTKFLVFRRLYGSGASRLLRQQWAYYKRIVWKWKIILRVRGGSKMYQRAMRPSRSYYHCNHRGK